MEKTRAFTLPELLIVFIIIGIISVISLYTINNRTTDYFTRYYSAYDALNKAVYNTYTDTYCRTQISGNKDCSQEEMGKGRNFPTTAFELCTRLKEYLNTTNECSKDKSEISDDADDDNFNDNTLQLVLSNGFRLYFSGSKKDIKINEKNIDYFIIYVDLNGDAKPNSISHKEHPDIVPFIATNKGDLIPVGHPIYDKTYATARVLNENGKQSISYTIDEARQLAFGTTSYIDIPLTLIPKFTEKLPVKAKDKNIHKEYNINKSSDSNSVLGIDFDCEEGTFSCLVKIDENLEKRY